MIEKFDFCRAYRLDQALAEPNENNRKEALYNLMIEYITIDFDSYETREEYENKIQELKDELESNTSYFEERMTELQDKINDLETIVEELRSAVGRC